MDCWYASLMPKMLSAKQPGALVFKEWGWTDCDGKPSIALYYVFNGHFCHYFQRSLVDINFLARTVSYTLLEMFFQARIQYAWYWMQFLKVKIITPPVLNSKALCIILKQGDNAFGSVRCLSWQNHLTYDLDILGMRLTILQWRCLCVCDQKVHADNRVDAVNQLLLSKMVP